MSGPLSDIDAAVEYLIARPDSAVAVLVGDRGAMTTLARRFVEATLTADRAKVAREPEYAFRLACDRDEIYEQLRRIVISRAVRTEMSKLDIEA